MIVSVDTETTGLDPACCSIIQFGACLQNSDGSIKGMELVIVPESKRLTGDPYALAMNADIIKRIDQYSKSGAGAFKEWCYPRELVSMFLEFLTSNGWLGEKIQIVGKNFAKLDLQFLNRLGWDRVPQHHRYIDVGSMVMHAGDTCVPDTSECARRLGYKLTTARHTALEDSIDMLIMFQKALTWKGETPCTQPE